MPDTEYMIGTRVNMFFAFVFYLTRQSKKEIER